MQHLQSVKPCANQHKEAEADFFLKMSSSAIDRVNQGIKDIVERLNLLRNCLSLNDEDISPATLK